MKSTEAVRLILASAFGVLLLACACSSAPSTQTPPAAVAAADAGPEEEEGDAGISATGKTHAVQVANFFYEPAKLTIAVGDAVKWTFTQGTHTVTSGTDCTADGKFDSKTKTVRGTYTRVFDAPGKFDYFCDYREHCAHGQVGVIEVKP